MNNNSKLMLIKLIRNLFLVLILFLSCEKKPVDVNLTTGVNNNFSFCFDDFNIASIDTILPSIDNLSRDHEIDLNKDSIVDFRITKVLTSDNMGLYHHVFVESLNKAEHALYLSPLVNIKCGDNFNQIIDWRNGKDSLGFYFQNIVNPSGSYKKYKFDFLPDVKHFVALKVRSPNGDKNGFIELKNDMFPMKLVVIY